jgi:hypothetical protein
MLATQIVTENPDIQITVQWTAALAPAGCCPLHPQNMDVLRDGEDDACTEPAGARSSSRSSLMASLKSEELSESPASLS